MAGQKLTFTPSGGRGDDVTVSVDDSKVDGLLGRGFSEQDKAPAKKAASSKSDKSS